MTLHLRVRMISAAIHLNVPLASTAETVSTEGDIPAPTAPPARTHRPKVRWRLMSEFSCTQVIALQQSRSESGKSRQDIGRGQHVRSPDLMAGDDVRFWVTGRVENVWHADGIELVNR